MPCGETVTDIKLVMLGLELDKQTKASDGKTTLRSIVEADIGKLNRSMVAMVAPSGLGKTATIMDLATKHFVIYCVCSTPRATISPDLNDPNFSTLVTDVERMYMAVVEEKQGNPFDIDDKVKACARERVQREFLARQLFLQLLLNHIPNLEPR